MQHLRTQVVWALVAVNVVLLCMFMMHAGRAKAADPAPQRAADYMMIPGQTPQQSQDVVYVIDMTNGRLGGTVYDDGTKRVQTMPWIDLTALFNAAIAHQR